MGVLNFCDPCGALQVREVKGQLEKLFVVKVLPKQDRCVICRNKLKVTKIRIKREKVDGDDAGHDTANLKGKKERTMTRTRLKTGTIKPFHFQEIESSEDENDSIDIPFDSVNVSEDSDSSSASSDKKRVAKSKKSKKSFSETKKEEKKKKKKKETKKGTKKENKKKDLDRGIVTDEEFAKRRYLDKKVLDMVDKEIA